MMKFRRLLVHSSFKRNRLSVKQQCGNVCDVDVIPAHAFTIDAGISTSGWSVYAGTSTAGQNVSAGTSTAGQNVSAGTSTAGQNVSAGTSTAGQNVSAGTSTAGQNVSAGTSTAGRKVNAGTSTAGQNVNAGTSTAGQNVSAGTSTAGQNVSAGTSTAGRNVSAGTSTAGRYVSAGTSTAGRYVNAGTSTAGRYVNAGTSTAQRYVNAGTSTAGRNVNAGTSTARQNVNAKGNIGNKIFAPFTVYKGKAALSVFPALPTFTKWGSGNLVVTRCGCIMMKFGSAIGEHKYDWEKSQLIALSPTEIGSLISLGPSDSCEFFHDPSILSSNAGEVRKSLSIKPSRSGTGTETGYFISLVVANNILKSKEGFTVPVTTAEFAVMKTACRFALPHIMGWDRLTNVMPRGTHEHASTIDGQLMNSEWDR